MKQITENRQRTKVRLRQAVLPFIPQFSEGTELKTLSSSCACQPSCALSGWTAPGLSAGPAAGGLLTASLPAASLWMRPFAHTHKGTQRHTQRHTVTHSDTHRHTQTANRLGSGERHGDKVVSAAFSEKVANENKSPTSTLHT